MMKHHDQSNVGRKRFIWLRLPYHGLSSKEVRTGTPAGQEPRCRSYWKVAIDWFVLWVAQTAQFL